MNRIDFLDYTKAIAIFFVISVHVGFSELHTVFLFAMPAFFIITGYTFNADKRPVGVSISLRFKAIMPMYWCFIIIGLLLEMLRAPLFGYGTVEVAIPALSNLIYGSGIIPVGGEIGEYLKNILSYKPHPSGAVDAILPLICHLWFLPATFFGYVIFVLIVKQTRRNWFIKAISVTALILFSSIEVIFPSICQLPYGIGRSGIAAAFMLVGFWLKEAGVLEKSSAVLHTVSCLVAAAVSVAAVALGSDGSAMVRSYYGPYGALSVLLTFVGGCAAAFLVLELCRGIDALPIAPLKRLLSFAGKNVLTVYLVHMAVKIPFDCIYIFLIRGGDTSVLDGYRMGLLPETSALYMIFEAVAVFVASLLLVMAKNSIQKKLISGRGVK